MMAEFKKLEQKDLMGDPSVLKVNPFELIGKEWYLITGGNMEHYNTMTASWGTMGIFWGKPVVNSFIRPQRYTFEFLEQGELFTLSFFRGETYRPALNFCGSHSGRDFDKAKECGLTARDFDGAVGFEEADMVLVCRKMYAYDIKPEEMIDKGIEKWYPEHDYHHCYFAEVQSAYLKK